MLLDELAGRGALSARINIPIWKSVRDKSVAGRARLLKLLLRLVASYPRALSELSRKPSKGAVLLAYPAIPDIFVVWPLARLRGHTIIFDAFISLHDTVVSDRKMLRPQGIAAKLLWAVEWLALRLADIIIVDTDQHGDFFAAEYGIARGKFQTILVGAEAEFWSSRNGVASAELPANARSDLPIVLFYGQLIPLHGLGTILDAIRITAGEPFHWLIIGSGQEQAKLRAFLDHHSSHNVTWLPWIDYKQLPSVISASRVALGIFGTSDKAARVIPNKAFQILAAGKPLITRESPAIADAARLYPNAMITIPPGDGLCLANAVRQSVREPGKWQPVSITAALELGPGRGVDHLLARLYPTGGADPGGC